MSGPVVQQSIGRPVAQQMPARYNETPAAPPEQPVKGHHRRTSTLSGIGERLFGRSGSAQKKQDLDSPRQRSGRKYPPTSMKDTYPADNSAHNSARPSMDSKRSLSFGLGKKTSVDLESQEEKPVRRFSLLPASMSFKGLIGSIKDQNVDAGSTAPQTDDFSQPPTSRGQSRPPTGQIQMSNVDNPAKLAVGAEGHHNPPKPNKVNNFSRPPQSYYQTSSSQGPHDVYGGTGVYIPPSQHPDTSYLANPTPPAEAGYRQAQPGRGPYPEDFNEYDDEPRQWTQQGRHGKGPGVLQKNRKFVDAYTDEQGPTHHEGSSGPAKRVMDFFRRRRARVDEYR